MKSKHTYFQSRFLEVCNVGLDLGFGCLNWLALTQLIYAFRAAGDNLFTFVTAVNKNLIIVVGRLVWGYKSGKVCRKKVVSDISPPVTRERKGRPLSWNELVKKKAYDQNYPFFPTPSNKRFYFRLHSYHFNNRKLRAGKCQHGSLDSLTQRPQVLLLVWLTFHSMKRKCHSHLMSREHRRCLICPWKYKSWNQIAS